MNYTNIDINGKSYGLRFGMNAVRDMDGVDLNDSIKASAKLILASHRNYCEVKESEPELVFSDVYDWVESGFLKQEQTVIDIVQDVWQKFNDLLAPVLNADKKKPVGKRSKKSPTVS